MENITTTSAHDLVEKIKKGEISSVEVCEAYLERIKKFDKDVKAWAFFDKKLLIEKAKEKDEYRKSGKPLGALHGLPIAVKDIIGSVILSISNFFLIFLYRNHLGHDDN